MRSFNGRAIAILEGRKTSEIAAMVERLGGVVVAAPAVREVPSGAPDAHRTTIDRVIAGAFSMVVILTGAGATALFAEADRAGVLPALLDAMGRIPIACRGPKPLAVLHKHGLTPSIVTTKPHTTNDLLEALDEVDMSGQRVMLLHYGEKNVVIGETLATRGAIIEDVHLYEWELPENVGPLEDLVRRLLDRSVDAVLFTSQIQFRFLAQVAHGMGEGDALIRALTTDVVVGAVGPVCASALRAGGVIPDVLPAAANSGSLVAAVADYFALRVSDETAL
jgi:uroporphyrinogen-III synthase